MHQQSLQRETMHRLWCRQLQIEFEAICFQYDVDLRVPLFEITGARKQYGCWLPGQGCIQLSEHLILSHPWHVTLQVLKHEMAHQVCSELFAISRPGGHGPDFQRACGLLGVSAPFRRAGGDLAGVVEAGDDGAPGTAPGRRMLARVRKLLALAGSDNEHEAALAMQRAGELMVRHNLELARADEEEGYRHLVIDTRQKIVPAYRKTIGAILRDYFYVRVVFATQYDPRVDQSFRTIELLGRTENVPVAEHCYRFLEERLHFLWQANRHRYRGHGRTARNSYFLGLLRGFSERLAAIHPPEPQTRRAVSFPAATLPAVLATEADHGLQRFVRQHFPRLRRTAGRRVRINSHAYGEAIATGRSLVLHGAVTDRAGNRGRLLDR